MNIKAVIFFVGLALCLFIGSQSLFIVDQTQQAIILQLGQPKGEPRGPGLHVKMPFVQNIVYFDNRILSVDPASSQIGISSSKAKNELPRDPKVSENKPSGNTAKIPETKEDGDEGPRIENISAEPIIVDTFARYRIVDPLRFLKTLRTIPNANSQLESIIDDSTRAVLGKTTLAELLSKERTAIMAAIKARVNEKIKQDSLGIDIIDVRIVRADLTEELRTATVRQMNSSLLERATERRAQGEELALEIRSTAEKERDVLLAEAQRDAQIIRGEGDREAIKIYAQAFNVDKEFYSFFRSLEAYRNTMANEDTRFIISPDGEFFKHFKQMQ